MAVTLELLERDLKHLSDRFSVCNPEVMAQRLTDVEAECGEVKALAKEVAGLQGQMTVLVRLVWAIVGILLAIFINGAFF